jgi:hypothetical protein
MSDTAVPVHDFPPSKSFPTDFQPDTRFLAAALLAWNHLRDGQGQGSLKFEQLASPERTQVIAIAQRLKRHWKEVGQR